MSDTERFKTEIIPLQPAMQRMAESLLGDEEDAADVVQDCFVSLWSEREKLQRIVNVEAWCITLVKRRCVDLLRKRRPTVAVDDRMDLADDQYDDTADERLRLALRLIDRLPERQALAVRLKHFDDCDTVGIAHALQTTEGNVYTLLSRAYQTLKQMILEYEKK